MWPGLRPTSIPRSSHLATTHGSKNEQSPLLLGEMGPHLTQCRLGWGLPPYQVASWSTNQPFGHNMNGPKIGGAVPLRGGGAGTPPNTMWPGPRPTCMPSFMLIHPSNCLATICQSYRRTDRTDRQWTDSIGQTVLQMVDQKLKPGLVVFYNIQPGNRVGLFWFRRFINLSLTYLLDTYLQHRTHTGHSCLL